MANDLNNGADKLLARILADAEALVKEQELAAKAETFKIKEVAQRDVQTVKEEFEFRCKKAEADILERSRTNAELDSRKYALKAKRDVVENAFTAAFDGLCALQGAERDKLLKTMAVREAVGGETIAAAKADADNMKRLLGEINAELVKVGKAELKMGGAVDSIGGGFLLQGEGFEKNCSFEAMLRDVREAEESKVAQILFG